MSALDVALGAAAVVGWAAAFGTALALWRTERDLGDARTENVNLGRDLRETRVDLEAERTQHARSKSEEARLAAELARCQAGRVADAPAGDLAGMSSRDGDGLHEDADAGGEGPISGPLSAGPAGDPDDADLPR